MRIGSLLALTGLFALGCGEEEPVDTCDAVCEGALVIEFADGRSVFEADLTGTGFSVTVNCPLDRYEGNVRGAWVECGEGSVTFWWEEANFPSSITVTSEGERWDFEPTYEEEEVCGTICESTTLTCD